MEGTLEKPRKTSIFSSGTQSSHIKEKERGGSVEFSMENSAECLPTRFQPDIRIISCKLFLKTFHLQDLWPMNQDIYEEYSKGDNIITAIKHLNLGE